MDVVQDMNTLNQQMDVELVIKIPIGMVQIVQIFLINVIQNGSFLVMIIHHVEKYHLIMKIV